MRCSRCQQDNPAHAQFCLKCGAPFQRSHESGSPTPSYPELQRALSEALEQQTATSEILRVIASSPTDVQPVFAAAVASAASLCDAFDAAIYLVDSDALHLVAHEGPIDVDIVLPLKGTLGERALCERRPMHVADMQAEAAKYPESSDSARRRGFRTILIVPLLRGTEAIGTIAIRRTEVRPFTERQVELLKTFADQAVIAIENVRLFTETKEALERQIATAEILRVISSSPTDLKPVFDTIARNAVRVCDSTDALVALVDGDETVTRAHYGDQVFLGSNRRPITRGLVVGRAVLEARPIQVDDLTTADDFAEGRDLAIRMGHRTVMAVPLLRGGVAIGAILMRRSEVKPFADKQITLLQTFADQAVIAIENVRLFAELEAKNASLTQALDQQTATGEILHVISSSPTDVQPVFDSIVHSAERLLNGHSANLLRVIGDELQLAAMTAVSEAADAETRATFPVRLTTAGVATHVVRTRRSYTATDIETDPLVGARLRHTAPLRGFRSMVMVPMVHQEQVIGVIGVTRRLPGAFSEDEVALLQTFADQAVIAIENVRLFTELQEKNRALSAAHAQITEALEQQTSTSEILRVISRSPIDVQPVFDAIASSSLRLCDGVASFVFRHDGALIHLVAFDSAEGVDMQPLRHIFPAPPERVTFVGRVVMATHVLYIGDIEHDHEAPTGLVEFARANGFRSIFAAPMLRDGHAIGAIAVTHRNVDGFTAKQGALLETFADQAVIAIENVRLFTELQERTRELSRSVDQLTALGEVGRAVSSTLDLETVLTTIVSRAVDISGLDGGVVFEYDKDAAEFIHRVATEVGGALAEARRTTRVRKGEGVVGQTALTMEPAQVPDITVPGAYESRLRENLIESGVRAILAVPMVREGELIGCLVVSRNRSGEFAVETIELLRTFATQSALAIQNARLFREIEQKSRELEAASRHKSEFLANMSHELRTPLNAVIGFSEVLSERMFGELNEKQDEYLKDIHASGQHLLSLINDILDLSKIEAGKMDLELSDFDLPMTIDNALTLVRERAARRSIALHTTVDERLGQIQGDERKIRQVLLNLLSNAIKFTPEGGRIEVGARPVDGSIEVAVTDSGVGIAPEDQEAVFEEFRQVGTAEKKIEGTGLGLALSRKFIELHGGTIWVKSQVGAGSTFTFTVPMRRDAFAVGEPRPL